MLVLGAAVSVFVTAAARGEDKAPAGVRKPSVIDSIETVDRPKRSFMPKYSPEWFVGLGYSGTFLSFSQQKPTLVLSLESLFLRPRRFDFGLFLEPIRLGRPDETAEPRKTAGPVESAIGPELMWRIVQEPLYDLAPVVRAAYLLDWTRPEVPLGRFNAGIQFSLVRSIAIQLTYDVLVASEPFTNGNQYAHGASVTFKFGICTGCEVCLQVPVRSVETFDRSPVACMDASNACHAAGASGVANARAQLCGATVRALDPSAHPANWGDPVGGFLDALEREVPPELRKAVRQSLQTMKDDHAASIAGLDEYEERLRGLDGTQMLNKKYAYLVTPVMMRDWMGCDAKGQPTPYPCPTDDVCKDDTTGAKP